MMGIAQLMESGILIGSRRWGGEHEESDWDYCIRADLEEDLKTRLKELNIDAVYHNYDVNAMHNMSSYKFQYQGFTLNFIFYDDPGLRMIHNLNKFMDSLEDTPVGEKVAESKGFRIKAVEGFFNLYTEAVTVEEVAPWDDPPKPTAKVKCRCS